jgi:hypothetical protein
MARIDRHPVPSLAWMECGNLCRERDCLRRRIKPATWATRQERRACDVCPVGTDRARSMAAHHRMQNALAVA